MIALPVQPADVAWPTVEWPVGPAPRGIDALVDGAFTDPEVAETLAVVVVQGGRIVAERYGGELARFDGPPVRVGPETTLTSWSMAKSMLHAVVGMLVAEGRLVLDDPAPVPAWSSDERATITLRHLLQMRDGLAWTEDYVDGASDVIEMLWGRGKADVAAFAADRPLAAPPGARFLYSSGTANIVSGIVARTVGPGEPYRTFLHERLLDPTGMTSARPEFDAAGTWVGSSTVYATARDFARFGLLYLRDGLWDGVRLLPPGWVDDARTPVSVDEEDGNQYGSHWWVSDDTWGTFWANGYEGQRIFVCPALDAVVVRLGKMPVERAPALKVWSARMLETLER